MCYLTDRNDSIESVNLGATQTSSPVKARRKLASPFESRSGDANDFEKGKEEQSTI